jgi:hypothetical protein
LTKTTVAIYRSVGQTTNIAPATPVQIKQLQVTGHRVVVRQIGASQS